MSTQSHTPLMNKRPLPVTIVGWVFLAAGVIGLAHHLKEIKPYQPSQMENLWLLFVRFLAIICGAFLVRGRNWARWLGMAWIAFHFGLSFFHSWQEVLMHGVIFVLIAYALFRSDARAYFSPAAMRGV